MNLQHINFKIALQNPNQIDFEKFTPVFHRWIQQKLTSEMLIDVAEYFHVPSGPGVLLIGHQANLSIDHIDSKWGFLYNRKTVIEGSNLEKLTTVLKATLEHARRLESEEVFQKSLSFDVGDLQFIVNDRLLAPNSDETFQALQADLKNLFEKLYAGASYQITRPSDARDRFILNVKSEPLSVAQAIQNLAL